MKLIIVESPTKARTLGRFLGKEFVVIASMGHIRDLPEKELGIDIEKDFLPTYVVEGPKKEKIVKELQTAAKKAEMVYLATDPDREGEAISWHIATILNSKTQIVQCHYHRISFHEITESAVKESLANPREIDIHLVDAQQARRILDRLVGYKISPVLWKKIRRGLSAGRVQSVAVRFIVEREREIKKFKSEKYFTITCETKQTRSATGNFVSSPNRLGNNSVDLNSNVSSPSGDSQNLIADRSDSKNDINRLNDIYHLSILNENLILELFSKNNIKYEQTQKIPLFDGDYTVTKTTIIDKKQAEAIIAEACQHDFVTSQVEEKETRRYPSPPFTTSMLQQESGRKFGFTAKRTMQSAQRLYEEGLITYHRTDSTHLASEAVNVCRNFIAESFGQNYLPVKPIFYQTKSKLAQEAHEAIRPTHLETNHETALGQDESKIYDLIWKKFVACQMAPAVFDSTSIEVVSGPYLWKAHGNILKFDGFLRVMGFEPEDKSLPKLSQGDKLSFIEALNEEHETTPPPRYTEAGLIKTLEEKGIGRPSTYAPIISTIQERQYVELVEKKFQPTVLGEPVNDFLTENFSEIVDVDFTAKMEDEFDEVAQGKLAWTAILHRFWDKLHEKIEQATKTQRVAIETEKTTEKCPECGQPLIIRFGRFGKFMACSGFPKCRFTKPLKQETGLRCPKCGGDVVIRKTKSRKTFYGCSNYPKCDFASWTKPKTV